MTMSGILPASVSIGEAQQYIATLDLNYIIETMCAPHYPLPRWTLADATRCAQLYKNFLILLKWHLPEVLVPTRQIDEFWHNHILYTRHYHRDCFSIFGHYLHHEPASPDDQGDQLVSDYLKTKAYYLARFQEPMDWIEVSSS